MGLATVEKVKMDLLHTDIIVTVLALKVER